MENVQAKSEPQQPAEPTTEQPEMSDRKRARIEHDRQAQDLLAEMRDREFSREEEAILDELGI